MKKISKSKLRKKCDKLWGELVKLRDNNQCVICGKEKYLNAHHLISRKVFKHRWKIDNGISLCPLHHNFSVELSAHTAPWAFDEWLRINRPEQYRQHCIDRQDCSSVKTDYEKILYELEDIKQKMK